MRRSAAVLLLLAGLAYFGLTALGIFLLSQAASFNAVGSLMFLGPIAIGAIAGLAGGVSLLRGAPAAMPKFPLLAAGAVVLVSALSAVVSAEELRLTHVVLGLLALIAGILLLVNRRQTPSVADLH